MASLLQVGFFSLCTIVAFGFLFPSLGLLALIGFGGGGGFLISGKFVFVFTFRI